LNDVQTMPLVGTPRQVAYAQDILAALRLKYPGQPLPGVESAHWWIEHQDCTPDELWHLARTAPPDAFSDRWSAFVNTEPRYGRAEAIACLRLLGEYTVLDIESTGIGKTADVVEIGVVSSAGEVLYESLIRPPDLAAFATSKAREANGIDPDELSSAPTLPEVWPQVLPLVTTGRLVAFNFDFDGRVLRQSAYRQGLIVPPIKGLCAMKLSAAWLELSFWPKLDEVLAAIGIERTSVEREHRAAGDALVTVRLIETLKVLSRQGR
jgi:DNA polymerase III epsilon subunit-like protein